MAATKESKNSSDLAEIQIIIEKFRELDQRIKKSKRDPDFKLLLSDEKQSINIPDSLVDVLRSAAEIIMKGEHVSVVSVQKEISTQAAANILNVSRPYLVSLLEKGAIPFNTVGTHRRIKFDDLMEYKKKRNEERRKVLAKLTEMSQEEGLYE